MSDDTEMRAIRAEVRVQELDAELTRLRADARGVAAVEAFEGVGPNGAHVARGWTGEFFAAHYPTPDAGPVVVAVAPTLAALGHALIAGGHVTLEEMP